MKNSPDPVATMSAVDHRDALAQTLDGEIMQLQRRRGVVDAQIASLTGERNAIDQSIAIADSAITQLKDAQTGLVERKDE